MVSIVIPTYNETNYILQCVHSLLKQSFSNFEIIIIDDGSNDNTFERLVSDLHHKKVRFYKQNHLGPGAARNFGAKKAKGDVLVFVDADMTFDKKFLEEIIRPIQKESILGTDSQSEYLANPENYWAISWNIGRFSSAGVVSPKYKIEMNPNKAIHGAIFRAVKKSAFLKAGGFDYGGEYTDDVSLSKKLRQSATLANKAIFYHYNPSSISEVFMRSMWIGADKHFRKNRTDTILNLIRFSPPVSLLKGILISFKFQRPTFVIFKLVYDFGIFIQLLKSI